VAGDSDDLSVGRLTATPSPIVGDLIGTVTRFKPQANAEHVDMNRAMPGYGWRNHSG
jgi:hypothetical protein